MVKSNFPVPGAAWVALLTFVAGWITQYFGEMNWAVTVVPVILGLVKMLELMNQPKPLPPPPEAMADPSYQWDPALQKENAVVRWLVG